MKTISKSLACVAGVFLGGGGGEKKKYAGEGGKGRKRLP